MPPYPIEQMSYMPAPTPPMLRLPEGACDTHCHIFGPRDRFPFAEGCIPTPHDAGKDELFALHRRLGIERAVIVQSMVHGFNHAAVADAVAARRGEYRGIALLPTGVEKDQLLFLHEAGFCGVRFNFIIGQMDRVEPIEDVVAFSRRLASIGWHLQIQFDGPLAGQMAPWLRRCATPVVIDHMGRVDASLGVEQPAFEHVLALLDDERIWVKLSGCERLSREGPPYRDAVPFAQKLLDAHGDRVIWGTDWPHPGVATGIPDDGVLVDLLADIAPSEAQRQALLVDNPARLYGFKTPQHCLSMSLSERDVPTPQEAPGVT